MDQAVSTNIGSFGFLAHYVNDDRYELLDGELTPIHRSGLHEQVVGFLLKKVNFQIDQINPAWFTPSRCLLYPFCSEVAFRPALVVLDRTALATSSWWKESALVPSPAPIQLVIDVISDDRQKSYDRKAEDYAAWGVPEY
jgi:Uma2 family endonuclease